MNNTVLEIKLCIPRWLAGTLLTGVVLLGLMLVMGAEPGSKDDPLATIGYVQRYAQFSRQELPSDGSLRLGIGAEIIPADTLQGAVPIRGLDSMRDDLFDLTTGERCAGAQLIPGHHYVNAGTHDVFLKFDAQTPVLLRGEWK